MEGQQFLAEFGHIANALGGVARLRDLVYSLASEGTLLGDEAKIEPVHLDRVATFVMGQAPPGDACNTSGEGVVFVKTGEFGDLYPVAREWTTKPLKLAQQGDVLICVVGATVGKLNLAIDCAIGRSVAAIRPRAGLLTRYLYSMLMPFTLRLRRGSRGSAQGVIGKAELSSVRLRVPSEDEQARIVTKVDHLMALCDELEQQQQDRRKLQNALRQATLQALSGAQSPHELQSSWQRLQANFGRLFSEPTDTTDLDQTIKHLALKGLLTARRSGEQVSDHLIEFADVSGDASSAEGDWHIPSHWIWARCAWLGEARLGKMLDASKNKGELRPYLRNINVRWHRFDLSDVLRMRVEDHELQRVSVRRGDLVICEGGEPGRAAIWNSDEEFVIQKALHRFRCGPDVLPEYMLFCLEHDYFSGRLARYYTGATIKHLTGKALAEYSIPLPPIAEQRRILEAAGAMSSVVATLRDQSLAARRCGELYAAAAVSSLTGITIEQDEDTAVKAPQTELIAQLRLATPPDVKAQAPLATILARHQGQMAARDLWQRFGGEIDAFYAQLKTEVAHGWIAEPEPAQLREKPAAATAKA